MTFTKWGTVMGTFDGSVARHYAALPSLACKHIELTVMAT